MTHVFSALKWLGLGFGGMLGGLQGLAFQALIVVALAGGAYVWGRADCSAIHATAGLQAALDEMKARAEAAEATAADAAALAAKEAKEAKKAHDAIERAKAAAQRPVRSGVCASTDFLRHLKSAR